MPTFLAQLVMTSVRPPNFPPDVVGILTLDLISPPASPQIDLLPPRCNRTRLLGELLSADVLPPWTPQVLCLLVFCSNHLPTHEPTPSPRLSPHSRSLLLPSSSSPAQVRPLTGLSRDPSGHSRLSENLALQFGPYLAEDRPIPGG